MNWVVRFIEEAEVGSIDGSWRVNARRGQREVLSFVGDDSGIGFTAQADGIGIGAGCVDNLVRAALAIGQLGDTTGGGFALDRDADEDNVAGLEELLGAG